MSSTEYELLGSAEKHIAKQLHDGFEGSLKPLRELLDKCESLAEVDFEAVMLHQKKRETAVAFVDILTKLPSSIANISLGVLIAEVIFTKEDAPA